MAIELESSGMSPRISFSHDFCLSDQTVPVPDQQQQQHPLRSNSTGIDFDFCVRKSFGQDSSSADELFCDGKILPTEVKKKKKKKSDTNNNNNNNTPQALPLLPLPPEQLAVSEDNNKNEETTSLKGISPTTTVMRDESGDDDLEEKQQSSSSNKSFWKFKRSSSLNCGGSGGYGRSLCPLPLMSRSNSTGSSAHNKDNHHNNNNNNKDQNSHRNNASIRSSSSSSSSSSSNYLKPPLKKSYYGNGGGIHVNPVLINVPSGNLFGLGSIFFNGKDKNKKK
ncbi:hypothetical protein ACOSP7_026169 [Xanthoceras sorbifolium]